MAKETSGNIEQGQNGGNSEVDNRIDVNTVVDAADAPAAPADAHVVVDGEVINLAELSADEILDLLDEEEKDEQDARDSDVSLEGEDGAIQVADGGLLSSDFSFDDPGNIHLAQAGDGTATDGGAGGGGGVPTGAWWALGGLGAIGIAAAGGGGGGGGGGNPNATPNAVTDNFSVDEDDVLAGDVSGNDGGISDEPVTYSVETGDGPSNGSVTMNADGTFQYTPDADFNGSDSFIYTVTDADGDSDTATVNITVAPVNDPPVATNDQIVAAEDANAVSGNVLNNDSDIDGDALTAAAIGAPVAGLTINSDGSYVFNPADPAYQDLNVGQTRTVTQDYEVSDGNGGTDTGSVVITLTGTNDTPVAVDDSDSATEGGPVVNGSVAGNDNDVDNGATLSYAAAAGQAAVPGLTFSSDGSYSFDPSNAAYQGLADGETQTLTFNYTVTDENGASDDAALTITVTGANDPVVAVDDNPPDVNEDGAILSGNVTDNDVDPDGDALTVTAAPGQGPVAGLTVNNDGSYSFNPADPAYQDLGVGESRNVTFDYEVSDGQTTDTGTLTIVVRGTNDAPVAGPAESYEVLEDGTLNIAAPGLLANDTDVDTNDVLSSVIDSNPSNGNLTLNADGSFSYTPNPGFTGTDSFTYLVQDDSGASNNSSAPVTVTIEVQPVSFEFTPAIDDLQGDGAVAEVFRASNFTLQAGDSADGAATGTDTEIDTFVHRLDSGAAQGMGMPRVFAGFELENIEEFEVTSDVGDGNLSVWDLSTTANIPGNDPFDVLRVTNSSDNVALTNIQHMPGGTTNVQILDQTAPGTSVTFDLRDVDAAGGGDTLGIDVSSATNTGQSINDINVDTAVENVVINTLGPLSVVIDTLNTDANGGATTVPTGNLGVGLGASSLELNATTANLTINDPLDANVTTVDGSASTFDLSYSAINANAATTLSGGSGDDTITGGNSVMNTIAGNAGDDLLTGGTVNDTISGGEGDDTIVSQGGNDSLDGNAGDDSINAGPGNNTVDGGTGADTVTVGGGNNTITGGEGNDVVNDGAGNSTITGDAGDDTVNLGAGIDSVDTGDGADVVNGGANVTNADRLQGGDGNDLLNITGQTAATDLDYVQGFDTISLAENGNPYNYVITDQVNLPPVGLPTPNSFDADTTIVTVDGSALTSDLTFNASVINRAIQLIGGAGDDTLIGGTGNDTLIGNGGNDVLIGNNGDDLFRFDGGELTAQDSLVGGNGADSIELINNSIESVGGPIPDFEEQFTLLLGTNDSVEDVNVVDNASGGDVLLTLDPNFTQNLPGSFDLNVDATELDAGESFSFQAGGVIATRNYNVASGEGDDSVVVGAGNDSVTTNGGDDSVVTGAGIDTVATGDGDDTVQTGTGMTTNGGNLTSTDQIDGGAGMNVLQVDAGTVDTDYSQVDNFQTLNLNNAGTTTLATNAENTGINTVNLTGGNDVLNAGGVNSGLTVNAMAGNDAITTGGGNDVINDGAGNDVVTTNGGDDTVNLGTGTDNLSLGSGDDIVNVSGAGMNQSLDFMDTVAGGPGADEIVLQNSSVTAQANLDNVTSVETYTVQNDGDDVLNVTDADQVLLEFTGGQNASVTPITVEAGNLTDPDDTFTFRLRQGQGNDNYSFTVNGSATTDRFVKENVGIDNNLSLTGGESGDILVANAGDFGQNITFEGDGLGAMAQMVNFDDLLNGADVSTALPGFDQLAITGGLITDDDFTNNSVNPSITNVEVLRTAQGGETVDVVPATALNATLGEFAALSGLDIVVGGTGDDTVTLASAFDNDLLADISAGGNDTINGGATASTLIFVGDVADYGPMDILTGGTGSMDVARVQTTGGASGTADLTGVTNVETIDILDSGNAVATFIVDTQAGEIQAGSQLITSVGADPSSSADDYTLQAGAAGADLEVVFTHGGDNIITTGSGDDTVTAGSGEDSIATNDGADVVIAGGGDDTVRTGDGNDSVDGGAGNDIIDGGAGTDTLNGGDGDDVILTGLSNADPNTDAAADVVNAGTGADTIIAGTGGDQIDVGVDSDADVVQVNPAGVNMGDLVEVNGPITVSNFDVSDDVIRINAALVTDQMNPTQTLNPTGGTAVIQAQGDSWDDAGHPELVIVTGTTPDADTALGVAQYLDFQDLAENNNGQSGIFAISDGTDTYLWLYQDDANGTVSAADFQLVGTIQGVATDDMVSANLELNYTFTPGDDFMLVASGSTVDGLAGDDTVQLFPDDGNATTLETTSIENVIGTSGDDSVTLVDDLANDPNPAAAVDFFSNGGNDTVNFSNGQQVTVHSNVTLNVGGGNAIDDDATGPGNDATPETVILADDGTPHDVTLDGTGGANAGVDEVIGSSADDVITYLTTNNATVDGNGGNDIVNGADGGQNLLLQEVESVVGGNGNDTVTADTALISATLGANDDILTQNGGTTGASFSGEGGDDTFNLDDVSGSTINGNDGDNRVNVDGVLTNSSVTGGIGNDTVDVAGDDGIANLGVTGSSINVGDGDNLVDIDETVTGSTLTGGAGMDTVQVFGGDVTNSNVSTGGADDVVTVDGMLDGSDVLAGAGDDSVAISNTVTNGSSIDGGTGNDTVTVQDSVTNGSTLNGDAGNDLLNVDGSVTDSSLLGGAGNDEIDTGAVTDSSVDAGADDDSVTLGGTVSGSNVDAGLGNDAVTVTGDLVDSDLLGNDGEDDLTVEGNASNSSLNGGADNDVVSVLGTVTDSTMVGGLGDDTVVGAGTITNSDLSGGAGNDTLGGFNDVIDSTLTGGSDDDVVGADGVITGSTLLGETGEDTVGSGSDVINSTVDGGADNDIVTVGGDASNADLDGGDGDDTVTVTGQALASDIDGGMGDDLIQVGSADTTDINGNDGEDVISVTGNTSGSTLLGDAGNDMIMVGNDVLAGSTLGGNGGNDMISVGGMTADSEVNGGTGNDNVSLVGNVSNATIDGGLGDDSITTGNDVVGTTLEAGSGEDDVDVGGMVNDSLVDLGGDNDTLSVSNSTIDSTVLGQGGDDSITLGDNPGDNVVGSSVDAGVGEDTITTQDLVNASAVAGGAGNDSVTTDTVNNLSTVDGGTGNDTIDTGAVINGSTVTGGTGDDDVTAASVASNGTVLGDAGEDEITVTGSVTGGVVDGGTGNDLISVGGDVTNSDVIGGTGNDTVTVDGTVDPSLVDTGDGNDIVSVGNDVLDSTVTTGLGDDAITVTNNVVNASIDGGDGNDTISVGGDLSDSSVDAGVAATGGDDEDVVSVGGNMSNSSIQTGDEADLVTVAGTVTDSSIETQDGDDTITTGDLDNSTLNGGNGADSISAGNLTNGSSVQGSTQDDMIAVGEITGSTVDGFDGADDLDSGNVNAGGELLGGTGIDDIDVAGDVAGLVDGGGDGDNISVTGNVSAGGTVDGGVGADIDTISIDGTVSGDVLGGDGDDDIDIGGAVNGTGAVSGEDGNDNIRVDLFTTSANAVSGGNGNDTIEIRTLGNGATITGDGGNDVVHAGIAGVGGIFNSLVDLGGGDDVFDVSNGLGAGTGSDNATIVGGAGMDTVVGSGGEDEFFLDGVEMANTGTGDDTVTFLTAANATVDGGAGMDTVNGSGMADDVTIAGPGQSVELVDLGAGVDTVTYLDTVNLTAQDNNEHHVLASTGDDTITFGGADAVRAGQSVDITAGGMDDIVIQNPTVTSGTDSSIEITGFTAGGDDLLQFGAGAGADFESIANSGNVAVAATTDVIEIAAGGVVDLTDATNTGEIETLIADSIGMLDAGTFTVVVYDDAALAGNADAGIYTMSLAADSTDLASGQFDIEYAGLLVDVGADAIMAGDVLNDVDNA
ncbi:MAG: Ig-like domain-containing protein [Salinisphaeraceae bacterium]